MELGQNIALAIIEAFVYFLFHLDNSGFKDTFLMKKLNLDSNFMASSTLFQKGQVNGFPSYNHYYCQLSSMVHHTHIIRHYFFYSQNL